MRSTNKLLIRTACILLTVGLFLAGGADPRPASAETAAPDAIGRGVEPVVVRGLQLREFLGVPESQIFVYRYTGLRWAQVPFQIDELGLNGEYVAEADGRFDANDELAILADDLGVRKPPDLALPSVLPVAFGWYELLVTDPLDSERSGYVYVVRSQSLQKEFSDDYVSFDSGFHRIVGRTYKMGMSVTFPGINYFSVGGGPDLLDRNKTRINCTLPGVCPITESTAPPRNMDLTVDGPVRVILRGGEIIAYREKVEWTVRFENIDTDIRLSTDFSAQAAGATLYSLVAPGGVKIDGQSEPFLPRPPSLWWQLNTGTGSLFHIASIPGVTSTVINFYADDASYDRSDTGDYARYGEVGLTLRAPGDFTYQRTFYTVTPRRPNLGTAYAAFARTPLRVTPEFQGSTRHVLFLPALGNGASGQGAEYEDFYVPDPLGQGETEPGTVLRVEHIRSYDASELAELLQDPSITHGVHSYRILYASADTAGVVRAVSGLLLMPDGTKPAGGYPVIAGGHLLPDQADKCAPSRQEVSLLSLLPWAAQGFIVSATDYPGLGPPGERAPFIGPEEARSVLDAARAARLFVDPSRGLTLPQAANQIFLYGHSFGAQPALFARNLAQSYASELDVLGAVAFAPVLSLRGALANTLDGSALQLGALTTTLYEYSRYYGSPQPDTWLQTPYSADIASRAGSECTLSLSLWIGTDSSRVLKPIFQQSVEEGRWQDLEPWTTYFDSNAVQPQAVDIPVFIGHSQADGVYPLADVQQFAQNLCGLNASLTLREFETANHLDTVQAARPGALEWMADRIAGRDLTSTCAPPAGAARDE